MKKAYIVTYSSTDGRDTTAVKNCLLGIGTIAQLTDSGRQASWIVIPEEANMSAASIRSQIFPNISPFTAGISVMRVDALDAADTEQAKCVEFFAKCKGENEGEPRNFNRFSSRHEAFLQYQIEKPRWAYADGIGMAISVDFDEWCWLPIQRDGIYVKDGRYDKYLRG